MLVLERTCTPGAVKFGHDTIVVGSGKDAIRVVLLETRGPQKARIGIIAPKHLKVLRLELYQQEHEEEECKE